MFRKSIVLLILVAFPLVADAQSRGRRQQSRERSPRAQALARPDGRADALLPAGARRKATVRFDGPHDDWRRWPQTGRGWWRQQHLGRQPFGTFYAGPYTGFSPYAPGAEIEAPPADYAPPATMTKGLVRLELTRAVAG